MNFPQSQNGAHQPTSSGQALADQPKGSLAPLPGATGDQAVFSQHSVSPSASEPEQSRVIQQNEALGTRAEAPPSPFDSRLITATEPAGIHSTPTAATAATAEEGAVGGVEQLAIAGSSSSAAHQQIEVNRFDEIRSHLQPVSVDVEKFHQLTARGLSGTRGVIEFLGTQGQLEAIHNFADPNMPDRIRDAFDNDDEWMYSEEPPYFWFEFAITDRQQQRLELLALFNIGDADANDGIWGEVFMLPAKTKIADIESIGDTYSQTTLTSEAPEFADHDSEMLSIEHADCIVEFPETQGQLPSLIHLAAISFYNAINMD